MLANKSISIILPAFNEEKTIYDVIQKIPQDITNNLSIIVIDDGSTDNTSKEAQRTGVQVFRHHRNLGVGVAMKTGVKASLENGADIIVKMDADGQHDPTEISRLLKPILEGEADLVVGARSKEVFQRMSFSKRFGNFFLSWLTRLMTGCKIYDAQSGFRAMTRRLAESISFDSKYTYTQEMIIKAARKGFCIKEVPINCNKRAFGNSKVASDIFVYGINVLPIFLRVCGNRKSFTYFLLSILSMSSVIAFIFLKSIV